jgi:GrpB-like predicted nucleotidyltransferase (UPF0157 family)
VTAIEVVAYDERWPAWFGELRERYERVLADVAYRSIEHVGSTSVSGSAAKPVIGIADRWAMRAPAESVPTNTYVVVAGSLALRNHLVVRDALRNDEQLRDEYGALKMRLADETDDFDVYVPATSPILQRILASIEADNAPNA